MVVEPLLLILVRIPIITKLTAMGIIMMIMKIIIIVVIIKVVVASQLRLGEFYLAQNGTHNIRNYNIIWKVLEQRSNTN